MDLRYSRYDPAFEKLRERLKKLEILYQHLLLQTDGDAEQALDALEQLGRRYRLFDDKLTPEDFRRWLQKRGLIEQGRGGGASVTKKGERAIRAQSLDAIFTTLARDRQGDHRVADAGEGNERLPETRAWTFGDGSSLLDATSTVANAVRRAGLDEIQVAEEDLAVFETEHLSSCATVLLIDVSHSMVLYGEDRITPAKRVALALTELVTTRYPKDSLDVVLFGDSAWQVRLAELPYIGVGPYHTNTRAGLVLAREILRKKRQANRRIFMLTDGKPSALTERDGTIYKNPFGLDRRVVNKTLDEAAACRRLGIEITTFMLTNDPTLVEFVERFTEVARGRAYFSGSERVGDFVLVDFVRNRKSRVR